MATPGSAPRVRICRGRCVLLRRNGARQSSRTPPRARAWRGPQLARAIGDLSPGDVLILAEWDRATQSLWDGLRIVKRVLDAGATIRVLDFPSLDLTTPEGRGFRALFSGMAERERMRIVKRTQEGRRLAVEAGKRIGRKPKLIAHQQRSVRTRLANGESPRDVAKDFAVHHATIARLR